ncbi:MAG: amidohydrolase family protein [Gammaproteobacteria bacterium]
MTADNITQSDSGEVTVTGVALQGLDGPRTLILKDGRVSEIRPGTEPVEWFCLPPLVDKHVHANRAWSISEVRPRSFEHSIELAFELFSEFTAEDYYRQSSLFLEQALARGTTGIRTHADVDSLTGMQALQGTLEARERFKERMDIEIVAFASSRLDPAAAEGLSMLKEAIALGADLLGAVPALYPEPGRSIDALLELAISNHLPVDVHLDEHLDPTNSWSEYLADATVAAGYEGRVTLSHGCALSVLAGKDRTRIIDKLLQADIEVIALPFTNLYLQDREAVEPRRRGLTCIRELLAAGVEVRLASDNVRDAFYPYGNADMLDTAYLGMLAGQMDDSDALIRAICDGRLRPEKGEAADLVLVRGRNFHEVLSNRPHERIVIRHSTVI